jgi:23S rRNA pseudouridine1911/1915/1917 synthase
MSPSRVVAQPAPLLAYLFSAWPEAKKKQVRDWLKFGCVEVNGRIVTQFDQPLRPGDRVMIHRRGMAAPETRLGGGILVRHEDPYLLVVEKPAGLLSIAGTDADEKTAYSLLTSHVRRGDAQNRERVWIVHRLDRDTSGLMLFAKSEAAKLELQRGWDAVEKKYFAVVEGAPQQATGRIESFLDESNPLKVYVAPESETTRRAVTRYRVVKKGRSTTLVELTLETGRRHQIRVQLAAAGCPIVGDKKYGAATNPIKRVALHATGLRFVHPVTRKEMVFTSPLPGDLGELV